jgi:hypothetical protein
MTDPNDYPPKDDSSHVGEVKLRIAELLEGLTIEQRRTVICDLIVEHPSKKPYTTPKLISLGTVRELVEDPGKRRPYAAPKLTYLGTVSELTRGAGGSASDADGGLTKPQGM